MTTPSHAPVLLDRVVALLAPALERPGSVLVDCTLGLGGHSEAVLERLPGRRVIGIDRDPPALADGERAARGVRRPLHRRARGVRRAAGGARPLGPRPRRRRPLRPRRLLDAARRRASAASPTPQDAPLDMRMDPTTGPTAADLLNTYHGPGADPHPAGVRRGEVRQQDRPRGGPPARDVEPFTTSADLVELLYATIPAPARRTGGHPAKRTFQALRMEVNDELAVLRRAIPAAIEVIGVGGRVVVEVVPLPRGPPGQAGLRRRHPARRAAGPAVRARGRRAGPAARHPRRRAGRRARDRREPASSLRPPARRRASPPVLVLSPSPGVAR